MFCKKCGRQIRDDSSFCTYCGTSFYGTWNTPPVVNDTSYYPVYTGKNKENNVLIAVVAFAAMILIGIITAVTLFAVNDDKKESDDNNTLDYVVESETVPSEEIFPTDEVFETAPYEEGSAPVTAPPAVVVVPPSAGGTTVVYVPVQPAATQEKPHTTAATMEKPTTTTVKTTTTAEQTTTTTEPTSKYGAYLDVIAQHSRDYGNLTLYSSYCLYDINHDGTYELFVHTGDCEAAGEYHVYTLNEQGASVHLGDITGGHSYLTEENGNVYLYYGHMGYMSISEIKMSGSSVNTNEISSQSDLTDYPPFGTKLREYDLSDQSAVQALG